MEAIEDYLELEGRLGGYEAEDARADALAGVYTELSAGAYFRT
jgi:hypothetical protein